MFNHSKSSGLMHLLNRHSYKKALLINVWSDLACVIEHHCEGIDFVKSTDISDISKLINFEYELVVLCLPSSLSYKSLRVFENLGCCETLIILQSNFSYNWVSHGIYNSLVGFQRQKTSIIKFKELFKQKLDQSQYAEYFAFPDVIEPELVLSSDQFSLYRRYWKWLNDDSQRSFLSFFLEFVFVKFLKSSFGAPFIIFKVNKIGSDN